ncbi:MAG: alpha-ketoglutarate transporter, partial [Microbacterium sp.]|nr:alpha-ketoglutarate transporter [Microbacterium sp.]
YALANSLFGGTAPLLYAGAQTTQQVPLFIVYVTVIIAASLAVYIFALRNKAPNWLDDELVMREAQQERVRAGVAPR